MRPGFRDVVQLVRDRRLLGRERVHEAVGELLERERNDAAPRRRVRERRRGGLERREREDEDALWRRRAHDHPGETEAAVEQQLDDQAAERVPDQDGRLVECTDLLLVVVDDLLEAEALDLFGVLSQRGDVAVLTRPLRGGDREAALLEEPGEVLPAVRGEPGSMDQHQRSRVAVGCGCHDDLLLG